MNLNSAKVNVLVVALLCCLQTAKSVSKDICQKHLHVLAAKQSFFVDCSTMHSVPVRLCISCEEPYTEMLLAYDNLRSESNCTERYFDKDRINIVSTTQSVLAGLWEKAYCPDCFSSNNSYEFDMKTDALNDCLNDKNNQGKECGVCLQYYIGLNEFYTSLDVHNNGKVCYDIQDSMNRTRLNWSKTLGCCHREFDMLLFITIGAFMTLIPIIFYGTMVVLTKRQERNHAPLIEDSEYSDPSMAVTPTASTMATSTNALNTTITATPGISEPTTSNALINTNSHPTTPITQKKKAKFNVDADSSDSSSNNKMLFTKVSNKYD